MLDYGFFGRTLGPLGEAMDFVIYWIAMGGRLP
ncbi:Integral membrane protein [Prescottella defluvii]